MNEDYNTSTNSTSQFNGDPYNREPYNSGTRHIPDVPNNGNKGKMPFWKKALAAVALGLLFGAFTGAGIYVAGLLTGNSSASNDGNKTENTVTTDTAEEPASSAEATTQPVQTISADTVADKGVIPTVTTTAAGTVVTGALDVSTVAENVMPSVVSITNSYVQTVQDIFGQKYTSESKAAGSGIIIGDNGPELLIVTNQHVVDDTDTLYVQFIDGSEAEANLKGEDVEADIAVIAVDKSSLSSDTRSNIRIATLGDSDKLKVGQTAIAIGNALGYGQSVTTGVISALNRELTLSNGTRSLIQTDAAINPGNSGGALLDINGNVIGINEAKLSNGLIEGMGYAIPVSDARNIIDSLMNQSTKTKASESERGYLGISGVDVTADISEQYNMPRGVYIAKVGSGLAADNAGLKPKSIITSFDGQSVQTMEQLQSLMDYYKIGESVEVVVQEPVENDYGYSEKTYNVTLGGTRSMTANDVEESEEPEQEEEQNLYSGNGFYRDNEEFFNDIFGNIW